MSANPTSRLPASAASASASASSGASGAARAGGVAARIGALEVLDLRGGSVELATLWRSRPVVLVFLRHYG
jgi:hypothetical protein